MSYDRAGYGCMGAWVKLQTSKLLLRCCVLLYTSPAVSRSRDWSQRDDQPIGWTFKGDQGQMTLISRYPRP
jgi:hypothetical protein